MLRTFTLIVCAAAAFAADDPWAKVKDLKSGTEIRIYKRGVPAPVMAKLDEVRDDSLSVVVKNSAVTGAERRPTRHSLIVGQPTPKSGEATTQLDCYR